MDSKKSNRKRKPLRNKKSRKRSPAMTILIMGIAIAGVASVLFLRPSSSDKELTSVANSNSSENLSADISSTKHKELSKIIGHWLRPDGGYNIEIRNIGEDGRLDALYFNPRPINVSQAEVVVENGRLKIFIELRDVGYPGARYSLIYSPQDDTLQGLYYQPSVGQSFEVIFIRKSS